MIDNDKKNITRQEIKYLLKKIDQKVKNITPDTEIAGLPDQLLQSIDDLPLTLSGLDDRINALGGLSTREIITQLDTQKENAGQRKIRYNRLKEAQEHPEIVGILNIYADEATTEDAEGEFIHVIHPDDEVRETIENMFSRTAIYDKAWQIVRNMCNFGDEFYEVIISRNTRRILKLVQLQRETIRRIELNGDLVGFSLLDDDSYTSAMDVNTNGFYLRQVNFNTDEEKKNNVLYPFRILHFKIPSNKYGVYGESILDSILSCVEQLSMMEKALLIARVVRAPERRIFSIDVGNLTGEQAVRYVKQVMDNFRNKKRLDIYTKRSLDYQKDIFGNTEDIAIPKRAGQEGNSIDVLPQLNNPGDTGDLEFVRDKIFPGVGVPRQYLFDDTFANANTNLSSKSVPFAKRIKRIQRYFLYQLYKLAFIELKLQGYRNDVIKDLIIVMTNPSNLDEKERLEIETLRWTLITSMKSMNAESVFFPDYLIYKDVLKLSDAEIVQLMKLAQLQAAGKNIFNAMPEEQRPEGSEELLEGPPPAPAGTEGAPTPPAAATPGAPAPGGETETGETAPGGEAAGGESLIPSAVARQLGKAPEVADVQPEADEKTKMYIEAQNAKEKFIQLIRDKNVYKIVEEINEKREFDSTIRAKVSYEELLINGELTGLNKYVDEEKSSTYNG